MQVKWDYKKNGGVLNYLSTGTTLPYLYISIIQCVKQVNKGHGCSSITWLAPYQQAVGWWRLSCHRLTLRPTAKPKWGTSVRLPQPGTCNCENRCSHCGSTDLYGSLSQLRRHSVKFVVSTLTNTPWPESASELYRPSDRSLSAKLVPTFADRGCRVVSVTDSTAVFSAF
jgi:hypothetical protein